MISNGDIGEKYCIKSFNGERKVVLKWCDHVFVLPNDN